MKHSDDKPAAGNGEQRAAFLKRRLEATAEGLKEGIRREIARRERLGLPIHVAENGSVVNAAGPYSIP